MGFTNSEVTEEKKLIWAGLKRAQSDLSAVQTEIDILRENVEFSTFQTDLDGVADYAELETYFTNNGFDASQAERFRQKIENTWPNYTDFKDFVQNQATSYEGIQNQFGTVTTISTDQQTEDGEPVAGIRVHDTAGISYAGVSVEPGTTEIFGRRIELSQQDPPRAEDGTISYSNLTTDDPDNVATVFADVVISADVTNTNTGDRNVTVSLTRDGGVVKEQTVTVNGGATKTVSFTESYETSVCYDYSIGGLSPITVCWVPAGLQVL